MFRRPGLDPATFATDLGMLAIQGFGDMEEQARDTMIRDKFIAGQGQCALRRQLDGFVQDTPIGWGIVDNCRVWESHSDSNWVSTVNYDSEVGSQPSDSRTWERRKVVVDMKRREPDVGNRKDDSGLSALVDRLCQSRLEEARRRDRPPTGGPACLSGGKGGHEVDRPPQVKAVSPHLPGIWLPGGDNEPDRGKNKNQKLIEGPGNKQRSERVVQCSTASEHGRIEQCPTVNTRPDNAASRRCSCSDTPPSVNSSPFFISRVCGSIHPWTSATARKCRNHAGQFKDLLLNLCMGAAGR